LARDVFLFAVPVVFFADAFLTPDFDRAVVFLAADFFVAVFSPLVFCGRDFAFPVGSFCFEIQVDFFLTKRPELLSPRFA